MKKVLILSLLAVVSMAFSFAGNNQAKENYSLTNSLASIISWESTSRDFGEIPQGVPVDYTFTFKNSGDVPLVISQVKTTCGCTASNWTKEAIQPGESSEITVTYNAARIGAFHKTVRVMSNSETPITTLSITGNVVK
jgi:hypothetical protein